MTTWCRQGLRRTRPHSGVHPYGRDGVRHNRRAMTGGPTVSTTAGPEASDQDESQPEPRDIEKPEGRKKAVAGIEIGMMPEGQGSTFEPEEDREPQG